MTDDEKIPMIPRHEVISQVQILAETQDYNHELMNIPYMWTKSKGAAVKLAVLDTGLPSHSDIAPIGSHSTIEGYLEDQNGHATHVAGIIAAVANNGMGVAGIAPEVEDHYCAVLNAQGSGSLRDVADGIRWAVDVLEADIISMSLGIPADVPLSPTLKEACDYAYTKGVTIFAAAGNEGGKVGQPAQYDSVIAVAAVDSTQQHASFSNTGPEVDFAAGGVNVYSTYLNNSYAKLSGTSMACPALAAVGALILSKHRANGKELSPAELKAHIQKITFDIGPGGFDDMYGHGIPMFGKNDNAPLPTVEEPELDEPKKDGPQADCVYWGLFNEFVQTVATEFAGGGHLGRAVGAGIKQLAHKTTVIDKALHQKK